MIPDPDRTEMLADAIVQACAALGATRDEVVAAALTVGINHAIAQGVPEGRPTGVVHWLYRYRERVPLSERVLVPEVVG